jgi:hypothetical protein
MGAPKGNQFWKARTTHGREKIFKDPDVLWQAANEYFQWVEDNPLWETKATQYQGEPVYMEVPKMRAMTISGLCLFLDIVEKTFWNYKDDNDFLHVINKIEKIIYNQKFAGASADLLNANIIARDLGLKDTTKNEVSGPNNGPIPLFEFVPVSADHDPNKD